MELKKKSKYMAMLLRHKPEKGNLTLDKEGYTDVGNLLNALDIDKVTLDLIVANDEKGRYSYDSTGTKIRANHGHSVEGVDITYKEYTPIGHLYHGTAKQFVDGIDKKGLIPRTRRYVHLSEDLDMAIKVGLRHAKSRINLVVFEIDYSAMIKDGYTFCITNNHVVLTKKVPRKYLKQINIK